MKKRLIYRMSAFCATMISLSITSLAQVQSISNGASALTSTRTQLIAYIDPATNLVYVICAIVGVVGGYRVYQKMQSGDQDAQKSMIAWGGSLAFILAVNYFIRTMLGIA